MIQFIAYFFIVLFILQQHYIRHYWKGIHLFIFETPCFLTQHCAVL